MINGSFIKSSTHSDSEQLKVCIINHSTEVRSLESPVFVCSRSGLRLIYPWNASDKLHLEEVRLTDAKQDVLSLVLRAITCIGHCLSLNNGINSPSAALLSTETGEKCRNALPDITDLYNKGLSIKNNNTFSQFNHSKVKFFYCLWKESLLLTKAAFTLKKRYKSCHWGGTFSKGTLLYLNCAYWYLHGTYLYNYGTNMHPLGTKVYLFE